MTLGKFRNIFGRSDKASQKTKSRTVDQQVHLELAEAADHSMVTTRLQDHNLEASTLMEASEAVNPNGETNKRKADGRVTRTPSQSSVKRLRLSPRNGYVDVNTAISYGLESAASTRKANVQANDGAQRFLDEIDNEPSVKGSSFKFKGSGFKSQIASEAVPARPKNLLTGTGVEAQASIADEDRNVGNESKDISRISLKKNKLSRKQREAPTESPILNGDLQEAKIIVTETNDRGISRPDFRRSTHKRFGSEDPIHATALALQDSHTASREGASGEPLEEDANSEDDVPETVTASAGLNRVRSIAADAAKAVQRQSLAKKEKRRNKDTHLKEQATKTKKKRRSLSDQARGLGPEEDLPDDVQDSDSKAHDLSINFTGNKNFKRSDRLPALLPDELLALEPVARPPTPPPIIPILNIKKRKFVDADPKSLKDLKRGNVMVRVLEDHKTTLPPRSSKASKHVKESWLASHRGRADVTSVRKKVGRGFLRR